MHRRSPFQLIVRAVSLGLLLVPGSTFAQPRLDALSPQWIHRGTTLDATLAGPGPYTVLAPDDAAFGKMPAGALDTLMKPEARADLTALLTYHILPGTILAEDIGKAIDAGKGKAVLATMGGGTLTATREGDKIVLTDEAGNKAIMANADETLANGVIHRVDTVLMPAKKA